MAPSAAVIGDVSLGKGASIWYGTVLRGTVRPLSFPKRKCRISLRIFDGSSEIAGTWHMWLSLHTLIVDAGVKTNSRMEDVKIRAMPWSKAMLQLQEGDMAGCRR